MIAVSGYPFNKARADIRPSQFGVFPIPSKKDCTREIAAPVALRPPPGGGERNDLAEIPTKSGKASDIADSNSAT